MVVYLVCKALLILYIHYEERKAMPLHVVQSATTTHVSEIDSMQPSAQELI